MGLVDLHSHLIPGVDDGVKTLDDAVEALAALAARGYDRVMTTPHQVDRWRPGVGELARKLEELRNAAARRNLRVQIGLGAENHIDGDFLDKMRAGSEITYGLAGKSLLIECSPMAAPPFLDQLIFELKASGRTPVLAHPERYPWMLTGKERVEALRRGGCLFQVDLGSFAGAYGKDAQKAARALLKRDAVDLVASDLHNPGKAAALVDGGLAALRDLASDEVVKRLTEDAPGAIFSAAAQGAWGGV